MEAIEFSLKNEVKNIFTHTDADERTAAFNEAWAKIINEQENIRNICKPAVRS